MALTDIFFRLDQLGFTDVFLPFILIYTIVFAILQKIKVFGGDASTKRFNAIIALALSLGVIIPHSLGKYPAGTDVVQIINTALPNISLTIIIVIFFLIILGMFGGSTPMAGGFWSGVVTLLGFGTVLFIFGNAAGWWEANGMLSFLGDPDIQATLIIIIVFWMIIGTITKEDNAKDESGLKDLGKAFFKAAAESGGKDKGKEGG